MRLKCPFVIPAAHSILFCLLAISGLAYAQTQPSQKSSSDFSVGPPQDAARSDAIFPPPYPLQNSRQHDCYGERREPNSKQLVKQGESAASRKFRFRLIILIHCRAESFQKRGLKSTFSAQIWRRGTPKKRARVYDVVFACALAHP